MAENKLADLSMNFAVSILKVTDGIKGHYIITMQSWISSALPSISRQGEYIISRRLYLLSQ